MLRVSILHRDLGHRFADPGELERPEQWTGDWVRSRLVEAFAVEKRLPDKKVGPAMVRNTWKIATIDTFADVVDQGELPASIVWEKWARAGGALPYEISRMEEALGWPGLVLSNGHGVEGRVLLAWGYCVGYGRSVRSAAASAPAGRDRRSTGVSKPARSGSPTTSTRAALRSGDRVSPLQRQNYTWHKNTNARKQYRK